MAEPDEELKPKIGDAAIDKAIYMTGRHVVTVDLLATWPDPPTEEPDDRSA